MITNLEGIIIGSPDATKLSNFYKEKVGLKVNFEGVMEEDVNLYMMEVKGATFTIVDHAESKGKSKEPGRIMFKLKCDDIKKEFAKLKKNGVKVHSPIYMVESYGMLATFEDLDGNYFQLFQAE